ncbi:hypothetical protein ACHAWC_010622 [Mediolabrus comicus]
MTEEADDNNNNNNRDVVKTIYWHMGKEVPDPNSNISESEVTFENFFMTNEDDDDPEARFHHTDGTDNSDLVNAKPFYPNLQAAKVFNNISDVMEESKKFPKMNNQNSFRFASITSPYLSELAT